MSHYFSKTLNMSFDHAVASTLEELKHGGFSVLMQIDMRDNLKKKLGVEFRPYLILGAYNPQLTYRALQTEDKIGTMLPCNIIVQENEDGRVEISAVDPVVSMQPFANVQVGQVAQEIRTKLQHVLDAVGKVADVR